MYVYPTCLDFDKLALVKNERKLFKKIQKLATFLHNVFLYQFMQPRQVRKALTYDFFLNGPLQ
jgi:hypothetical protein